MQRIINIVGSVALGVTLSQVPEFSQQYHQRLGGAVDELRAVTQEFNAAAEKAGLSQEEALQSFDTSRDEFLAQRGTDMRATFERYERLSMHLAGIENAGPFEELVPMIKYIDPQLAQNTYQDYEVAVPITIAGFIYAGAGLLGGYSLVAAMGAALGRRFKRPGVHTS